MLNRSFWQYNLANMHYLGLGVPVNKEKAFELYEASAQKGVSQGFFNLGPCPCRGSLPRIQIHPLVFN